MIQAMPRNLMHSVQQSVRDGPLRPLRKVGLAVARRWPWPVSVRLNSGRRMYVDLRSAIGRGIFAKGEFDALIFGPLRTALREGGTFLDVGANVGFYSMLALEVVGATGAVHAFEVDQRPLRCLRRTIEHDSIANLHLHEVAVGHQDGVIGLAMRKESGHTGVVLQGGDGEVRMLTLDTWWRSAGRADVQAIKIDIEGAELLALQGAKAMLEELRPLIVCESDEELQARYGYDPPALMDLLAELRYRITPLDGAWSPTIVAHPQ